jgi:hypothetical protein
MPAPKISTVGEALYWAYANLAMAHAAVVAGESQYGRTHFMIRSRLFKGLMEGTMDLGALVEDERLKLRLPQACCYCGSKDHLAADHLISRKSGGLDVGDNLIWACRSCNSSKGALDLMVWTERIGRFPSVLLLRRYLKLAIGTCRDRGLMDLPLQEAPSCNLPFDIARIPTTFPAPDELRLWVAPLDAIS